MNSTEIVEDINAAFGFLPVKESLRSYVLRFQPSRATHRTEAEMTPKDWDKFEKDIADAFEKVP